MSIDDLNYEVEETYGKLEMARARVRFRMDGDFLERLEEFVEAKIAYRVAEQKRERWIDSHGDR